MALVRPGILVHVVEVLLTLGQNSTSEIIVLVRPSVVLRIFKTKRLLKLVLHLILSSGWRLIQPLIAHSFVHLMILKFI